MLKIVPCEPLAVKELLTISITCQRCRGTGCDECESGIVRVQSYGLDALEALRSGVTLLDATRRYAQKCSVRSDAARANHRYQRADLLVAQSVTLRAVAMLLDDHPIAAGIKILARRKVV